MYRVFAYGTLRTGASNAFRMKGAASLGKAIIKARLYQVHEQFPGIALSNDESDELVGEIFGNVSDDMLKMLDVYEGCDAEIPEEERLYRRVLVQAILEGGEEVTAYTWEFVKPVNGQTRIPSGDWLDQHYEGK